MTYTSAVMEIEAQEDRDPLIDLLTATAEGDKTAFAQLYKETSGRLFAIALSVMKDRGLGEEVLQDAFLVIWRKADQYAPDKGAPLAWMTTIVRNRAIDKLRQTRKSAQDRPIEDCTNDAALIMDPRALMEQRNVVGKVRAGMDTLPKNQQMALLYAYYYGMTHEELAQRMDAPLGTVKSWVRRGLDQLRDVLGDELQDEFRMIGKC